MPTETAAAIANVTIAMDLVAVASTTANVAVAVIALALPLQNTMRTKLIGRRRKLTVNASIVSLLSVSHRLRAIAAMIETIVIDIAAMTAVKACPITTARDGSVRWNVNVATSVVRIHVTRGERWTTEMMILEREVVLARLESEGIPMSVQGVRGAT